MHLTTSIFQSTCFLFSTIGYYIFLRILYKDEKNKKIHYCERFVLILMVCMNIFLAIFNIKTFLLAS